MENAHVPQPVYRPARLADLHDIADIEAGVFPEPYLYLMLRQLFELHGSEWLVAELDGAVIGYALTLERGGRSVLFTFAVVERLRCRGYGRSLVDHVLHRCVSIGAEVTVTVHPDNDPAWNLFKRAGFVFEAHDDRYFGPGEPRDILRYAARNGRALRADRATRDDQVAVATSVDSKSWGRSHRPPQ